MAEARDRRKSTTIQRPDAACDHFDGPEERENNSFRVSPARALVRTAGAEQAQQPALSAAQSRDQAAVIFRLASKMVRLIRISLAP